MKIDKYLEIFSREAEELLTALRQGILHLEKEGLLQETVVQLMRSAHTLKGSARLLGLQDLSHIAHKVEGLLRAMASGDRPLSSENIDLLLVATDGLEALIAQAHSGGEIEVRVDELIAQLDGEALPKPAPPAPPKEPAPEKPSDNTARVSIDKLDGMANLLGEMLIVRDSFDQHSEQFRNLLRRLDAFLVTLRRAENYRRLKGIIDDFTRLHLGLEQDTLSLNYLTEELHDQALSLRMLPLSILTPNLERLVRDLTREQGKTVNFIVTGDSVELDRLMIETIKPMLLHMLRNAIDHAMETSQERQQRGKPERGEIRLSARYERGGVRIAMTDDGRGIDPEQLRRLAVKRKMISAEEAQNLGDEEALYLILRPGFSTKEIITDVSGRGVGMDVVQALVDKVKGNLTIHSTLGSGTEIILRLPLTLAVINALLVECGNQRYAVPMHYIGPILRLSPRDILREGSREVIRFQDRCLPLLDLRQVLDPTRSGERVEGPKLTAVILRYGQEELACLVDRSLGVQDMVVKTMGSQLKSVYFFSGVTILADGSPALILSAADLFDAYRGGTFTSHALKPLEQEELAPSRILVVDDSITTRTMEKNILETHGYEVEVAIDGKEALEILGQHRFDLVVTDIEMPGMNGFELTRKIRGLSAYQDTPVIIVSSRSSDEDKRRGIEVGAQAYIVKSSFDQGTLLQTVQTLIG